MLNHFHKMSAELTKFWLNKSKILFLVCFIYYLKKNNLKNEQIAHFLFFGERCEWISQVAHQKWAMWANLSGRSPKMSDHEWLAQVAQRKWAIMSVLLRSLTHNEWMKELLIFLSESLIRSFLGKKQAFRSENRWANSQPCILGSL